MVNEVWAQVKEMLEAGTIHPRQSPRFNTIVLVHKKDGGLHFCINFHKLNVRTKKDSYLLTQIQEDIESPVGAGYLSCLDLKMGFWPKSNGQSIEAVHCFHHVNPRIFQM